MTNVVDNNEMCVKMCVKVLFTVVNMSEVCLKLCDGVVLLVCVHTGRVTITHVKYTKVIKNES